MAGVNCAFTAEMIGLSAVLILAVVGLKLEMVPEQAGLIPAFGGSR
ncbi:MAG: hypothetical protein ACOX1H_05325 [Pseudoramibacter sp.]